MLPAAVNMGNVVLTVVLCLYDYGMTVVVLIIIFCSGDDGDGWEEKGVRNISFIWHQDIVTTYWVITRVPQNIIDTCYGRKKNYHIRTQNTALFDTERVNCLQSKKQSYLKK